MIFSEVRNARVERAQEMADAIRRSGLGFWGFEKSTQSLAHNLCPSLAKSLRGGVESFPQVVGQANGQLVGHFESFAETTERRLVPAKRYHAPVVRPLLHLRSSTPASVHPDPLLGTPTDLLLDRPGHGRCGFFDGVRGSGIGKIESGMEGEAVTS